MTLHRELTSSLVHTISGRRHGDRSAEFSECTRRSEANAGLAARARHEGGAPRQIEGGGEH